MPGLFHSPKPSDRILPRNDNGRQKLLPQDLENQDILLEKTFLESLGPKFHRSIAHINAAVVALFLFTVVAGSLAWLGVSATLRTDDAPKSSKLYTDCGSNHSTAIAAGCVYDIVAPQWTPPECYNAPLSEEYARKIPKPMFFRWPNLTEPIPEDPLEISRHDTIWTFDAYHTMHCVYILELAALAAGMASSGQQDVFLNHIAANSKHTKHCTELLSGNNSSPGPTEIHRPGAALRCKRLET
ncbi:hypothetical protein yc1106_08099 [Curvularia clavata]|uniref:Uncharacterized protein n=1 Tax=Curvularia clavata TaxID=95742 RepID=A0A9Q8ZFM1_CURCL|nr:hypothetical protein yc1106_08099 [Curvularia clavata]